jgi:hypothetical protein
MGNVSSEAHADSALRGLPKLAVLDRYGLSNGKDFNRIFHECVDESLPDLLGTKVRDTAYLVFQRNYSIARNDIPHLPSQFGSCLDQVFSVAGKTIGRTIARRLYSRLGLTFFEKPGYEFHDYIEAAKP